MSPVRPTSQEIPVLFTADEIRDRVRAMAVDIAGHVGDNLLVVSLLRGSFVFTADLIRELFVVGVQPQVDFMTLSSYGNAMTAADQVTIHRDITVDVNGRQVLVLDDILESGRTLAYAQTLLRQRGARDIRMAVLLEKPGKRAVVDILADHVGFTVPDRFVVGYGLDYANYYRELPYIGVVDVH